MTPKDTENHICAKPVESMEWLLSTFIPVGLHVVDPFMGSGSTGVACIRYGCRFTGVEIDDINFDYSVSRCEREWISKCSELPFDKPTKEEQRRILFEE